MNLIRRLIILAAAALSITIAAGSAAMADSSAPTLTLVGSDVNIFEGGSFFGGTWYGVDATDVCRSQYRNAGVVAGTLDTSDAASLGCWAPQSATDGTSQGITVGTDNTVTVAQSGSVTFNYLGGLDIQAWCTQKHPGSGAVSVLNTADTWACIR